MVHGVQIEHLDMLFTCKGSLETRERSWLISLSESKQVMVNVMSVKEEELVCSFTTMTRTLTFLEWSSQSPDVDSKEHQFTDTSHPGAHGA